MQCINSIQSCALSERYMSSSFAASSAASCPLIHQWSSMQPSFREHRRKRNKILQSAMLHESNIIIPGIAGKISVTAKSQPSQLLRQDCLPKHIAVIMDGNARWAEARGLRAFFGHRAGLEAFKATVTRCNDWGIRALTVFAFSSENWQRSDTEVAFLMSLFTKALRDEGRYLHDKKIRFRSIGDKDRLPAQLQKEIDWLERLTENNIGMQLSVAMSFSGRGDIARAAQRIAEKVAQGLMDPSEVDEKVLGRHLLLAPVIDQIGSPDLLIRTSGEQRLSNFLLWDIAYTELVFSPVMWPDFDEMCLSEAIAEYQRRDRRFGGRLKSL